LKPHSRESNQRTAVRQAQTSATLLPAKCR
jgi:hypothetical protein